MFQLTDMEESVLLPIEGPSTLTVTRPNLQRASSGDAAWIVVVIAGITAALHIWKLPAALPLIQEDLGLSLLTAGVLLGIVQVAGMLGGLAVSLLAENIGERRTLLLGLVFLSMGSVLGGLSIGADTLLASRAIEGIGFIVATVVGPGLIRRHAPFRRVNMAVGCWSAYQGTATFIGLIASAYFLQIGTWQLWWWVMAAVTLVPIPLVLRMVPQDQPAGAGGAKAAAGRIGITARSPKVWIAGLVFGCYTVQWMAVVGFLPTVYGESGLSGTHAGILSAIVGGLNGVGAIITGILLQRGAPARVLLFLSFILMGGASLLTFAVDWSSIPGGLVWQVACVGFFSFSGAMIPATMTRMAVDLAPEGGSAPAAMGLMQQIYNIGNFTGPMIVAWLAMTTGGWSSTWWMTCAFAALGIILSVVLVGRRGSMHFSHS
ncbi:putative cyanate transporter [Paeniglutamicibacter gangotriensis Lz1y]|uniref:Putative cyanate transporter n=1 Tax=Paeniglutamicibacter gangotriensis Lz1y TaxID=1276920 RepID=M7NFA7_9MICC|nr:putative cyanate transporter [Paeniglutamicibacter gangotriensis Lz1y]